MRGDVNSDLIKDVDTTDGNTDVAQFGANIDADQLWFVQSGYDLQVSIIGTNDSFIVQDWYMGDRYHVEQFKTSDGKTLLDSQVQNLVQATAGFSPLAEGQTTMPAGYASALNTVIAAISFWKRMRSSCEMASLRTPGFLLTVPLPAKWIRSG